MKVRIYKPHTHAGLKHVPGPTGISLDVSTQDAAFLKAQGVLDPPSATTFAVSADDEQPLAPSIDPA